MAEIVHVFPRAFCIKYVPTNTIRIEIAAMGGKGFLAAHFRIPDGRSVTYEKTQRIPSFARR